MKNKISAFKNSLSVRLLISIIAVFILITIVSNFFINYYTQKIIENMAIEFSASLKDESQDGLYLIINESQVKSDFEIGIYSKVIFISALLVGTFLIYLIIKKNMKPLNELSKQVSKVNLNEMTDIQKIEISKNSGYEIEKLSESFNKTLNKIYRDYEKQRNFNNSVAHELRTPLAVMSSKIEVFKMKDREKEEYEDLISTVEKNISRLSETVEGILSLTRNKNIKMEKIYLKDLVDEVIFDFEKAIKEKNLKVEIKGDAPNIYSDDTLLNRVFYNLIDNAIKYNEPGGKIEIEFKEDESFNIISIKDTGIGIKDENKSKIFDMFYRENRNENGNGIGLSIVKDIADTLGFEIFLFDNLPKGSIFEIKIKK